MIDSLQKSIPFFKFGAPNRAPYYYLFSLAHARNQGLWLEFATHDGTTINLIAEIMHSYGKGNQIIYGFDSFEGLPEDWRKEGDRYNFDMKGKLPKVAWENIRLVKGWFNETIPKFLSLTEKQLKGCQKDVAMIHIDSDLYSSAITVLKGLKDRMRPGTVIMFDQIHDGGGNYPEYREHEYKAWSEFSEEYNVSYRWLAHAKDDCQASLIIEDI